MRASRVSGGGRQGAEPDSCEDSTVLNRKPQGCVPGIQTGLDLICSETRGRSKSDCLFDVGQERRGKEAEKKQPQLPNPGGRSLESPVHQRKEEIRGGPCPEPSDGSTLQMTSRVCPRAWSSLTETRWKHSRESTQITQERKKTEKGSKLPLRSHKWRGSVPLMTAWSVPRSSRQPDCHSWILDFSYFFFITSIL